jgi:hypothetical protein
VGTVPLSGALWPPPTFCLVLPCNVQPPWPFHGRQSTRDGLTLWPRRSAYLTSSTEIGGTVILIHPCFYDVLLFSLFALSIEESFAIHGKIFQILASVPPSSVSIRWSRSSIVFLMPLFSREGSRAWRYLNLGLSHSTFLKLCTLIN